MEVRVKYQLLTKATISSMSYNSHYNVLAVNTDSNDTATFFALSPELHFTPMLTTDSRPPSTRCVAWSPNGKFIAVANTNVQIWKFDGFKMAPLAVFHEGYIEIKNLVWSPDSQSYLCYGVNPKDMPLAVNIRRLENSEVRQILTVDSPVMANFDPFGKYVMVLLISNSLELYDARTLDKVRVINLAESKNDLPTKGDRRIADWSSEFSYFVCPNLNDGRVPSAVILDRTRNFGVKDILIGHQATISCCKFNPNIYEHASDITFVLAIGDSSGCLSFWRVGKYATYDQPLFIVSSPPKAEQSIDDMQWNSQGNILLANVLKRYIVVLEFDERNFGKKMTDLAKANLIVGTYGASGANQIAGAQLEVFGQNEYNLQLSREVEQKCVVQTKFNGAQKPKQQMVKTAQQIIYSKDSNNKQKKRIIPSRLVPESEVAPEKTAQQILSQAKFPSFKIPSLRPEIKREYSLPNQQILQVEMSKDVYILSIKSKPLESDQQTRIFNHQLKLITVTKQNILVVSNQKFFIFDLTLRLVDLPCWLGQVCNFTANNEGVIFYMLPNGLIRGFNYLKHSFILQTSAAYILMGQQHSQITVNPFSIFTVFDNDADKLHVELKDSLSRYFFCKESNSWVEFDFNDGFYMPGHSLRISQADQQNADNFYMNLVNPAIWSHQKNKKESAVDQFELQLLYYGKYVKNPEKFKESLIKMLLDLKSKGNSDRLRKQIVKYFMDRNSAEYLNDVELWGRVKKIGGKVIEQFLMLRNQGE